MRINRPQYPVVEAVVYLCQYLVHIGVLIVLHCLVL